MEIYFEYAFIDNFTLNFVTLTLTCKLNKIIIKKRFLILITLMITIVNLTTLLLSNNIFTTLIWFTTIILSCTLILNVSKIKSIKKLALISICQLLLTYLILGCLFLISLPFNNGQANILNMPVGIPLIAILCCYFLIKNLINYFISIKHLEKFTYNVCFLQDGNKICANAFLDSGNKLMFNQKPVILINYNLFNKLFPKIKLSDILLKNYNKLCLKNINELDIKSIAKTSKIMIFELENVNILDNNKSFKNVVCGLSLTDFKNSLNADCILNAEMFN